MYIISYIQDVDTVAKYTYNIYIQYRNTDIYNIYIQYLNPVLKYRYIIYIQYLHTDIYIIYIQYLQYIQYSREYQGIHSNSSTDHAPLPPGTPMIPLGSRGQEISTADRKEVEVFHVPSVLLN